MYWIFECDQDATSVWSQIKVDQANAKGAANIGFHFYSPFLTLKFKRDLRLKTKRKTKALHLILWIKRPPH